MHNLWDKIPSKIGALVENFSPESYSKLSKRMSRFTQLGYAASIEAMKDSNLLHWDENKGQFINQLDHLGISKTKLGVCIGSGTTSQSEIAENYSHLASGNINKISPFFVPKILGNITSGWVSIDVEAQGPNISPVTACATGLHAIGDSVEAIRKGDADIMIAGGTESCIDPLTYAGFCRLRALCINRNDDPLHSSRPFDKYRSGFVMGEGAGILILESLDSALAREVPIYGEILGYGRTGDGFHLTSPEPDGNGAFRAMEMAIRDANKTLNYSSKDNLQLEDIRYVNAHATSTPMGDEIEYKAIKRMFQSTGKTIYVNSIKGSIGHCIGAAGSIETIATILSLKHQIIPSSLNFDEPEFEGYDPSIVEILKNQKSLNFKYALSNSFGFGGTNSSLLLMKYDG